MEEEQVRGIIENIQKELDLVKSLVCGETKREVVPYQEEMPYEKHLKEGTVKRQNE